MDQLFRILSHEFYVVSPLISLSSMWSFLWLVDSSDASCCHSKPPHSGTDLLPLPLKHCGTPRVHVSPPGGLEWHWDHNIIQPSWLCCSGLKERVLWRFWSAFPPSTCFRLKTSWIILKYILKGMYQEHFQVYFYSLELYLNIFPWFTVKKILQTYLSKCILY